MALYDVVQANRQAVQTGTALGQAMFSNSLRMQQLKSEQALQQLQQQQAAEMLSWTIRQHHMAIDQEAKNAKSTADFMARISPTISVPLNDTDANDPNSVQQVSNPYYNPNMGAAFIQSFLPSATNEKEAANIAATGGALMYHQGQMQEQEALAAKNRALINAPPKPLSSIGKMQADRATAMANGDFAAVKEIDAAILKQHSDAASEVGKMVEEHKRLTGKDFTPEEVDQLYKIKAGLAPRAAVVQPLTFGQFANKNLQFYMDNKTHFDAKTQKLRRPSTTEEAMADLKASYDSMQDHIKRMPAPTPMNGNAAPVPEDTVIVVDPQGRKFKLPRQQLEEAKKRGYKEYEG